MKILFLSNIPTPYQMDFFSRLSDIADVNAVFLWGREANRDWSLSQRPWLRILKGEDQKSSWAELYELLVDFKPDCVLVGGYRLPLSFRLKIFCTLRHIPFHYWLEKPLPTFGMRKFIRSAVWIATLPFAKSVLCIGNEAVQAYRPFSRKVSNLPYSIDSRRYVERKALCCRPLKCLYVGQYIPRKGVPELLQAFAKIKPDQANLTLVGSGDLQDLVKKYVVQYENINDLGFVDPDQLPSVISKFDILVAPSLHDGWAVVVVEAMISGLPVISTRHTGAFVQLTSEMVNMKIGEFCIVNAESIREAVMNYVYYPENILVEGKAAREVVMNSLAESKNAARQLIKVLKN